MLNALCHVHDDSSPLFLMFHGYGNDEHEMIRVIEAVGRHDPMSYISFRAPFEREYMGGYSWYPHGCGPEARRRLADESIGGIRRVLDSPICRNRPTVCIGFSQGGYMSLRMVLAEPTMFDAAILMSPSFVGGLSDDERERLMHSRTRFLLCYGEDDTTIPRADQCRLRECLQRTGRLTYRDYPQTAHAIVAPEIQDIREFIQEMVTHAD